MRAPLFTYAEAAQALTVSKSTVMRLCAEGKLRVHILGPRTHRIDSASVEAYLSDTLKQVEPTTCRYGKTAKRGGGVSLGGGTPVSGSARTRAEANKQEAEATSRLDSGLSGKPILHSMEDAFARYLRSPEFLSLKSANDIAKTKIPPWKTYIEGKYLADASDVAEAAVRDWLKPRGKKPPLAIATINRRLAVLRRILSLAFRQWSWLDIDLSARIPLLAGETQRQTWLTNAESIRLRRACRPGQLRAVVTLLVCTGMRIGELLRIGPDDCRDGAIFLDARTKTGKPRVVPIIPPGSRYLHHLPITRSYDGLRSAFDLAKRRAGLPHIRMHDLRHTVGSQLAESGASLRDIQVWLGHTNPATTTRYTHIERARLDAVARNLLAHRKNKTLTT